MNWFVYYWVSNYIPGSLVEFGGEESVIKFLNEKNASYGADFRFQVIEGTEVQFTPVAVATAFKRG